MYQPPPLRGRSVFDDKRVLLIDPHQPARSVRARVLRRYGVEVDIAEDLGVARSLWRAGRYDLIMLDARRYLSRDAFEFYEQVKSGENRGRFVFLVGPPEYLSTAWPNRLTAVEKLPDQWAETVRQLVAVC